MRQKMQDKDDRRKCEENPSKRSTSLEAPNLGSEGDPTLQLSRLGMRGEARPIFLAFSPSPKLDLSALRLFLGPA